MTGVQTCALPIYYLQIVRGIILKGVGLHELWIPLLVLCAQGILLFMISVFKFRVKL